MPLFDIENDRDLSDLDDWNYTFIHDKGKTVCSYGEYLANTKLREMIHDAERYKLIIGNTIFTYSKAFLNKNADVATSMRQFSDAKMQNPLRFFAPSGKAALDFLNDYENDICIFTAPNRFGKTQTMLVKKILSSIPCDPNWEIFTKYGVKWRPFTGPKRIGLSTYDLGFHEETTLTILLDWIPKSELGVYATDYTGKGAKRVNFNDKPKLPLDCGSTFVFAAVSQKQSQYEGSAKHEWGWDEQGTRAIFIGANERTRTAFTGGRHDFALTPHKIEGRPDTGANSWIKKVWDGEENFGLKVGCYLAKIWSVPDWIYPERAKGQAFFQHIVEPNGGYDGLGPINDKSRREGRSRFYGEWHEASGLVIDEWNPAVHLVDPFDIPANWSLCRGIDHGIKHPMATLWGAISPAGDLFIYREYLKTGCVISQNTTNIVEKSGNKTKVIGQYNNPKNGLTYDKCEEVFSSERYEWSVFDGRAFSQTDTSSGLTLAKLYSMSGLKMVQGSGQKCEIYVPIVKEWFVVDFNKKHYITGKSGAPRIYIFNSCKNFIRQIRGWTWEERKTRGNSDDKKESPSKKDDDLMDCLKLMLQKGPRFTGKISMMDRARYQGIVMDDEEEEVQTRTGRDPISGY